MCVLANEYFLPNRLCHQTVTLLYHLIYLRLVSKDYDRIHSVFLDSFASASKYVFKAGRSYMRTKV